MRVVAGRWTHPGRPGTHRVPAGRRRALVPQRPPRPGGADRPYDPSVPLFYVPGAAIKLSPALGVVYLAARARWRDAGAVLALGLGVLAVSVVLSPDAWRAFLEVLRSRGPADVSGFLPIPYVVRAAVGGALAVAAGRIRPRYGEPLLVVAIVVALPTLWFAALATLAAVVPLIRRPALDN
jgi:hypothetical protein